MIVYLLTQTAPDMLDDYGAEDLADQILYSGEAFPTLAAAQRRVEKELEARLDWQRITLDDGTAAWHAELGIGRYLIRELTY